MQKTSFKENSSQAASKILKPLKNTWDVVTWGHKPSADYIEDNLKFYASSTFIRFAAATAAIGLTMDSLNHGVLKPVLSDMPSDERTMATLTAITVAGLVNDCLVKAGLKSFGENFINDPKPKVK